MKVIIQMDCGNAAFDPENGGPATEVARILRNLADQLDQYPETMPGGPIILRDINGNLVGGLRVENWKACTSREEG